MKIYKRMIYILTTGIMLTGLMTFYMSSNMRFEVSGAVTTQPVHVTPLMITPTPVPEPEEEPNPLLCEAYPEIHSLVKSYYDAKIECDREAFRSIVTDISYLDMDEIQAKTSAVTAYTDITCYTKRGFDNIDLVCYVHHYMDIVTIDTPVLSLDELYIQYDETGDPLIFMGEISSSTQEKLVALRSEDDVSELISSSLEEIDREIASDEDLLAFWKRSRSDQTDVTKNAIRQNKRDLPPDEQDAVAFS